MRYLSLSEVLDLYLRVMSQSGGAVGVRDLGSLEAALALPRQSFAGEDLYPTLAEKAATLGYSIIQNHPFIDGNKRIGHAAMELFLMLNAYEIHATVDEQEKLVLGVASGVVDRKSFTEWLEAHIKETTG